MVDVSWKHIGLIQWRQIEGIEDAVETNESKYKEIWRLLGLENAE